MADTTLINGSAAFLADLLWPVAGTIGYVCLLSDTLFTGSATADPVTNTITTATPHGMVTGSRFIPTAGTLPSGLPAGELWAIATGANTLKAASSLANAIANTPIPLVSAGSGIQLTEQLLSSLDPLSVLLNKELPAFPRQPLTNVGPANPAGLKSLLINFTNGATAFSYQYTLILRGGSSTTGSSAGVNYGLIYTDASPQTVGANEARLLSIGLGATN